MSNTCFIPENIAPELDGVSFFYVQKEDEDSLSDFTANIYFEIVK